MIKMNKRQFIQTAINSGIVFSLNSISPLSALAQETQENGKLLLVLRFNGAWDTLMATDARTKEFLNAQTFSSPEFLAFDERVSIKQYKEAQLGICMEPLFGYLDDLCIVNGIMMNYLSTSHETNREYMSSGNIMTGATFFPFALARAMQKKDLRIGYYMEYETLQDGNYAEKMPTKNLDSFSESFMDPFETILDDESPMASLQKRIIVQRQNEKETIKLLNQFVKKVDTALTSDNPGMTQASLALAGLGSGFLQMAQVDVTEDEALDTHDSHKELHAESLTAGFDHVAKMIKFMKETPYKLDPSLNKSLFDMTTVVITSEFARTAAPEKNDGTDHNQYNNSCILFGGNVNGGTIIGSSHIYKISEIKNNYSVRGSLYHATPFNYQMQRPMTKAEMSTMALNAFGTCKSNSCYDYIYPETIWRTIAQQFSSDPIDTLTAGPILKNIFKT